MKNFLHHYNKIFPRKFGSYWEKNKSILNIDNDLKKVTNSFIQSKSYNLVSNYWNRLNIENYKFNLCQHL
jgi:CRISPR/Cas system CMR-associated protein Cmr5 small subunit